MSIVAILSEGPSLVVFAAVVCKLLEGERMLDRLSMRELPCWKEWFPIFFSGVFHFFKSQSRTCCSHCDMRHVATVSNHILNKTKISKIAVPLGIGRPWQPKWWVLVFFRASWISSHTSLSVKNINQCIDSILKNH